MAIAQNSRDVRIRIIGENLLGGSVRDARRDLTLLGKSVESVLGGKAGKFFGAAVTGGAAGLIAGTVGGTFAPKLMSQFQDSIGKMLDFSEPLAKAFGIVTERAREMAKEMSSLSKSVRDATAKVTQQALAPSQKAREELFGGILPEGGIAGLLGGRRQGKFASALGDIETQRQELIRQQRRGLGADWWRKMMTAELGNIDANKGFAERMEMAAGGILPRHVKARVDADMALARANVNSRSVDELKVRNERFSKAQSELTKREEQLRTIQNFELGFRGAGPIANRVAGLFGGMFGTAGRSLFGGLRGGVAGFGQAFEMNREGRLATESPAETLRRELGNLQRDRGRGLSEDVFDGRRRQLRLQAIGQLQAPDQIPGLAPTEGRFITMGRRNEVKDELSHLRRELKAEHAKDRAALAAAIREIGGGNDAL